MELGGHTWHPCLSLPSSGSSLSPWFLSHPHCYHCHFVASSPWVFHLATIEHVCMLWVVIGPDWGHNGISCCQIWFWGPLFEVDVWLMGGNAVEVLVLMIVDWRLVTGVNKMKIVNNDNNKNKKHT